MEIVKLRSFETLDKIYLVKQQLHVLENIKPYQKLYIKNGELQSGRWKRMNSGEIIEYIKKLLYYAHNFDIEYDLKACFETLNNTTFNHDSKWKSKVNTLFGNTGFFDNIRIYHAPFL